MRRAGQKDILQVDEAGLLAACGKSEVGLGGTPSAVPIRDFQAKRLRLLVMSLADGDVHRGVCWVHPSLGNEPQRPARRYVVAQVDLDIVIAGKALVLSAAEGIEVSAIELADDRGHIGASIVDGFRDGVRRRDGGDGQLDRRNHEPLIGKNLGAGRMVDHHQLQVVVVVGFP